MLGRWLRPDREKWKPVANVSDNDEILSYQTAAKKLGIDIKFGYPVPAVAGADFCHRLGMKGVYILRSQADREDELSNKMFDERFALSR